LLASDEMQHDGRTALDLLLTDVMPGVTGRQVAEALITQRSALRVI
jgi:hypothetical protein